MDSAASPETTRQTPRTQDVLPGVQSFLPQDDTGMCLVNQVHMVSPQDWDLIGNILLGTPYPVIKMEWAGRRGSASAGRLCPGSTLYPRAGDPGSAWTNSPSDEGSSSLTHKEISVSNPIQNLKEGSFREDTNPAVSTWTSGVHVNFRGQENRLRNQSAWPDSELSHISCVWPWTGSLHSLYSGFVCKRRVILVYRWQSFG